MPTWILHMLIDLAVKLGLPYLMKRFNWLPAEIWVVIEDILAHVKNAQDPYGATADIHAKVKECIGVACSTDLK